MEGPICGREARLDRGLLTSRLKAKNGLGQREADPKHARRTVPRKETQTEHPGLGLRTQSRRLAQPRLEPVELLGGRRTQEAEREMHALWPHETNAGHAGL